VSTLSILSKFYFKPTTEEQQPPNPIKEVFIDESVEEEENEQKNPKVNILFIRLRGLF